MGKSLMLPRAYLGVSTLLSQEDVLALHVAARAKANNKTNPNLFIDLRTLKSGK